MFVVCENTQVCPKPIFVVNHMDEICGKLQDKLGYHVDIQENLFWENDPETGFPTQLIQVSKANEPFNVKKCLWFTVVEV